MPLRDHFRSPVNDRHTWDELHGGWPMMIVRQLYDLLPRGYVAAPTVHLGQHFEIDVTTFVIKRGRGSFSGSRSRAEYGRLLRRARSVSDWSERENLQSLTLLARQKNSSR